MRRATVRRLSRSTLHAREAGDAGAPVALMVHGWPGSSFFWRAALPAAARAGWRAVALDLPGHGDSALEPYDGTWAGHVRALGAFVEERGLRPEALVVHDWGGLIALRWAIDAGLRPRALVLSGTGFFADGRWHGVADTIRGAMGEQALTSLNRTTFGALVRASAPGIAEPALDEYWKGLADEERRLAVRALYVSGEFSELEPYEPRLPEIAAPALLLWGRQDRYTPLSSAHRFRAALPDTRLVILDEAAHFVLEDAPERAAAELEAFLASVRN